MILRNREYQIDTELSDEDQALPIMARFDLANISHSPTVA